MGHFHGTSWNSVWVWDMEFHGIPWSIFHGTPWKVSPWKILHFIWVWDLEFYRGFFFFIIRGIPWNSIDVFVPMEFHVLPWNLKQIHFFYGILFGILNIA